MKNLLLGALLSSGVMFGNIGHSSHHSSHHSSSHSSSHVSSHTSGHATHSYPHTSTLHSNSYHPSAQHPYHQTSNIRTSHVEYHPVHRFFYYPIMNHHTRSYDTIKGATAEEVQTKVNSYNTDGESDINWIGIGCFTVVVGGVAFFLLRSVNDGK